MRKCAPAVLILCEPMRWVTGGDGGEIRAKRRLGP